VTEATTMRHIPRNWVPGSRIVERRQDETWVVVTLIGGRQIAGEPTTRDHAERCAAIWQEWGVPVKIVPAEGPDDFTGPAGPDGWLT